MIGVGIRIRSHARKLSSEGATKIKGIVQQITEATKANGHKLTQMATLNLTDAGSQCAL